MHLKEAVDSIEKHIDNLTYNSSYDFEKKEYLAKGLNELRKSIIDLEDIAIINNEIIDLKNSVLFSSNKDEAFFSTIADSYIKNNLTVIKEGFKLLKRMYVDNLADNDDLYIKLPEIENFDDLGRLASELKRAIEIPINEQSQGGHLKIKSAEPGSIWLLVSLGAFTAVNLVGAICWAAAIIRKKNAEAKIFEQHAKTLEIKNDSMDIFVNAQRLQLENILENEAQQIMSKHYDSNSPEVLAKLKLSITTVSDLIEKGTKILPASDSENLNKTFPDYSNLNLIESTIKMLNDNSTN